MSLRQLIPQLASSPDFAEAAGYAFEDADFSVAEPARAALLATLLERRHRERPGSAVLLAIAATSREADALRSELASLMPHATTLEFPAWETLPHERLSPSAETVGRRIAALSTITRTAPGASVEHPLIVVASVRAALQPIVPHIASLTPIVLRPGSAEFTLTELAAALTDAAYSRVDMVTRRGEFAVRGGIREGRISLRARSILARLPHPRAPNGRA